MNAPIEDVYRIVSDFERAPEYFPLVAKGMKIISRDGNNLVIEATTNTFGINFSVNMQTTLLPGRGFTSINTSKLAIEDEQFLLETVPDGTRIDYRNNVTIKNNLLKPFSRLMINGMALKFWEFAYINRLKKLVAAENTTTR